MGDDCVGRIEDRLCRSVILLQADRPCAAVLLFKVQDIFDGSATEAVNTLVIITHHADIFVATGKERGK